MPTNQPQNNGRLQTGYFRCACGDLEPQIHDIIESVMQGHVIIPRDSTPKLAYLIAGYQIPQ